MSERVLVAMSGGVDSSAAAALLVKQGFDVVGAWMRLGDLGRWQGGPAGTCRASGSAEGARRVAAQLGVPFHFLDLEREFAARVVDPFVAAYLDGRTPNPCVVCNAEVKFGALLGRARHLHGCRWVATGHYARIDTAADPSFASGIRHRLLAGRDLAKDQSYFLYGMGQEQLAATRFPLGELTKQEVRGMAARLGLASAHASESQEICFALGGDYRQVLRVRAGWRETPGRIVDSDGRVVGEHRGIAAFTVGQRAGLAVALGEPRYVAALVPTTNEVRLGRRDDLMRRAFEVEDTTFVSGTAPSTAGAFPAQVRVRHRAPLVRAAVRPSGEGRYRVETEEPVWAPAPGQAAVFYRDDEVLGGGTIAPD